jgi:hypothetical protein
MMQQHERLYQLDKPILARDAAGTAAQGPGIPPGWIRLDHCNLSPFQGQALLVPYVLLHPEIGVALIDIAPAAAAGAEAAFRDRLESARFGAIFPGQLPVVHLQLHPEELGSLGTLLPQAFATLPPLRLPGGDGWVSVVRRALASRGPLRDGPAERARDRAMPQMLNREVAAQRAGLAPAKAAAPAESSRVRWPALPIALGLAGLTAVAAASAVFLTGSQPAEPLDAAAPPPERSGAPATERSGAPAPAAVATGGAAPVAAPVVAPRLVPAAPPAPARAPDMAQLPPARDRAATTPPRAPEPTPPPPARAQPPLPTAAAIPPPPAAVAPERASRLTVRAAANIRTQPNNKATIIRTAPQGEVLREFNRSADDWVEVGDTKPQGWMFGKFLVPVKP